MSQLALVIDELAAEDLAGAEVAALGNDLTELAREMSRLEAEFARRLAVFDARGGAAVEALPTAAWLRHHCRFSPAAAAARLGVARRLADLPVTAAAFASGEIGFDHARVIALPRDPVVRRVVAEAEPILVEHARQRPAVETSRLVAHVVQAAAPELLVQDFAEKHERRWLNISETFEGCFAVDGLLDPEAGATVRTAIHALVAAGRTPEDLRSPAQARADALAELARRALDAGALPETAGERPHLSVTVSLDTLEARAGSPAASLGWAGPITGEAARRLACDAKITRIITGPASQPLDVGRTTRVVSPALRKALELRDGGCVWPGCDRPPPWTDAHHKHHWANGGPTSPENLVLLCRRHHRATHEGGAACPTTRAP